MINITFNLTKNYLVKVAQLSVCFFIVIAVSGCLGNYGRLNRNPEIQEAFESNQVPSGYDYYYYGLRSWPYAVMGLDPSYNLRSRIWRTVEADTDEFKHMTKWIWSDYGYYPYGAYILDPDGQKIGIFYTSVWFAAVKVDKDTKTIEVMPHIFLGGP
jgi:hypothetical protein